VSGLYLSGMEMPKGRPVCIVIDAAGQARRYDLNNDRYADDKLFEAIPVHDHGRLIDADSKTFPTPHRNPSNDYMKGWNACLRSVQQQPIIIPANTADKEE